MTVFDAHCDTVQKITDFGGGIRKNSFHWDIERINDQNIDYVQVFAAFINKETDKETPFERCNKLIDCYFREINLNKDFICHCQSAKDIEKAIKQRKIAALLSIEGGEALAGKIENLYHFFERGVRCLTLTWNYSNEICDGIDEVNGEGLSEFGMQVVLSANDLGMLLDVSHISEKGFWDVLEQTKKPIVATHSNAKTICPHRRNLSDEQILALINNGGCIGINLYSEFVSEGKCEIKDVLKHIEHILTLGGENNVGIGCDFDGMESLPKGINGVQDIHKLFDEMKKIGYADLLINKIASQNFLKLLEKSLG